MQAKPFIISISVRPGDPVRLYGPCGLYSVSNAHRPDSFCAEPSPDKCVAKRTFFKDTVVGYCAAYRYIRRHFIARDRSLYRKIRNSRTHSICNAWNIALIALTIPDSILCLAAALQKKATASSVRINQIVAAAASWVIVAAVIANITVYHSHPHLQDEVAYYLQGRLLAAGYLTAPGPLIPQAFTTYLLEITDSRWYAVTPAGWPAFLALGFWVGFPSLVNPLLAGGSILLAFLLTRRLYGENSAIVITLLLAFSPWLLFLSMSYMNHVAALTAALGATYAASHFTKNGSLWWAGLAGAATGLVGLIRPLDGLIVALILGTWAAFELLPKRKIGVLLVFLFGMISVSAIVLPYNAALTGHPLSFPLNTYLDKLSGPGRNAIGFGANRGLGWGLDPNPGHSPLDAAINANLNWTTINQELFRVGDRVIDPLVYRVSPDSQIHEELRQCCRHCCSDCNL